MKNRIKHCDVCERRFVQRSPNQICCPECQHEYRIHRLRVKYKQRPVNDYEGMRYVLEYDPTGDYKSGARFCAEELEQAHLKRFQCFAPGTVFRRDNTKLVVTKDYRLVPHAV